MKAGRKEGLIASNYECSKCNERMTLYERKSAVLVGFKRRFRMEPSGARSNNRNSTKFGTDINDGMGNNIPGKIISSNNRQQGYPLCCGLPIQELA
ncbi:hypothetical protein TNCV_5088351 [Trichonephila clavipes]|nr:hypothetical protein TNCV_5088351 [Trichonephila clavipes]